ncbi:TIGR03617 family F420-dependent LLM class oxidoreductase [Aeromicrobium sp. NPDC092404]|uniref:TIGR03617 family F420-dependent LLM class oxidoreductase n=1 Tax=Aeromicrobium sp. NPDC092404 TaxID=3154976 RepID=UPI0034335BD5
MTDPILDIAFHGDAAEIAAVAAEAEARGVGGLFVAEAAHDPYIAMALAGTATSRIRIGSSVAIAFARTPMSTAYSAWDVHRLSGGRLVLGLGTQIKPHITRRFDMPWSSPAPRMTEYVEALRAIFASWQDGSRLDFQGDFYEHTLMPPLFDPGPVDGGPPPIWLAAVGPRMLAAAGSVADGLICHPLLSRSYLDEVIAPTVVGARSTGPHAAEPFTTSVLCMVATGRTEEDLAAAVAGTKRQIGFYASTPAYLPVLEHHGWSDLHTEAHALTKSDRWAELGDLVDDEVLSTFAVVGELAAARDEFRTRFTGSAQRVITSIPYDADNQLALDLVGD